MDLNDYKYIVTSGCSYGQFTLSISEIKHESNLSGNINYLENKDDVKFLTEETLKSLGLSSIHDTDDKVVFIDVSQASQSSDWISDTTQYTLTQLFNLGIKSENIYVLVEWTQVGRISVNSFDWMDIDTEIEIGGPHHLVYCNFPNQSDTFSVLHTIKEKLNIKETLEYSNVGKIENKLYLNPLHTAMESDDIFLNNFIEYARKYELTIPTEEKINRYFTNILSTQHFLKLNNIKYNFVFMQGSLIGWKREKNNILKHNLENRTNWLHSYDEQKNCLDINKHHKTANDENTFIEKVADFISFKFDMIDFKNIWFHESEKYKRGGIDEWAIEKFGVCCMTNSKTVNHFKYEKTFVKKFNADFCNYGNHPNLNLYKILWNEVSTNCDFLKINEKFVKRLEELYWEDVNYDGISKNNIVISEKTYFSNLNLI